MAKLSYTVSFNTFSGTTVPVTHKLFESKELADSYARPQVSGGMYKSYNVNPIVEGNNTYVAGRDFIAVQDTEKDGYILGLDEHEKDGYNKYSGSVYKYVKTTQHEHNGRIRTQKHYKEIEQLNGPGDIKDLYRQALKRIKNDHTSESAGPVLGKGMSKAARQSDVDQSDNEYAHQREFRNKWKKDNPDKKWPGYHKAGYSHPDYKNYSESMIQVLESNIDNFTSDDIHQLVGMPLDRAKIRAIELISTNSKKPMRPEKVSWFKKAIAGKRNTMDVVKLMYDLLLSGEGNQVLGTRTSTNKNSYRAQFGESKKVNEDISTDALEMEQEHEVQLARAQLYHAARDAIRLHRMLKDSGVQDIDNTMAAKIGKAAEYLASCSDYFEYTLLGDKIDNAVPVAPSMPTATPMPMESKKNVNEISKEKAEKYIRKATDNHQYHNAHRKEAQSTHKKDDEKYHENMMKKRNKGMTKAFNIVDKKTTEMASGGATGVGGVAVVSKPMGTIQKRKTPKGKK